MMKSSFDLQPTLEDEILILKALKEEDLDDLYKVASDPMILGTTSFKRSLPA